MKIATDKHCMWPGSKVKRGHTQHQRGRYQQLPESSVRGEECKECHAFPGGCRAGGLPGNVCLHIPSPLRSNRLRNPA